MQEPTIKADLKNTTRERVTLKEIARLAGVSVSTASLVLADKARERRISEEVVNRVREVARQQDYAPNLLVRSLRQRRTHVISFYNAYGLRELDDVFMDRMLAVVERAASAQGYELLLHCDHSRTLDATYRLLNGGRSDGLLFFGPHFNDPMLPLLRRSSMPIVILNRTDEEGVLSSVSTDIQEGMRLVADRMIELGHRRIAAISNPPLPLSPAPKRIAALRAHLAERGVELVEVLYCEHRPQEVMDDIRRLVEMPDPITALFCWSDRGGYDLLETCESLGIPVPGRLSVIGYDGLRWPSTSPHTLTSVVLPLEEIANQAVQTLDRLITGQEESPVRIVLPLHMGEGTTVAPAPGFA